MTEVAWSAAQIVTLAAGSSVLAAILTQGVAWIREWLGENREGKFAALYIAIALETYAEECSTVIYDTRNYVSSDGNVGERHGNLASIPEYPAVNWQAFGIKPAEEAMNFRTEVGTAREAIKFLWNVDFEDAVVEQVLADSAELGLRAFRMAKQFRTRKGLSPRPHVREFSVETHLETCHYANVERRRRSEEQAKLADPNALPV